ncbi:hypothetical protein JXB41_05705 [Candidatus Woesearchaeota archaeon]|nr:hypothetical protein [Candidatus Woesearchaeota archaeon]
MARDDSLIEKQDPKDVKEYNNLLNEAIRSKREIEKNFITLAESILTIHKRKLYKIEFKTFEEFCTERLGFSRQTIYIYIGIFKLMMSYPNYFPQNKVLDFGHKKMRHITEGASAIDKTNLSEQEKEKKKASMFKQITPNMSALEIEEFIDDLIAEII